MRTKLVYVLTCKPDALYIEQALISVYSARYYNLDAHIVLIVDDRTDILLQGKRAELLQYITEKIVVDTFDADYTPMQRSRWLKTHVRELITGDYLFIDCDTVITGSLTALDDFSAKYDIAAVLDCNKPLAEWTDLVTKRAVESMIEKIGGDLSLFKNYYSSGVMFVKDNVTTHAFYKQWHQNWIESNRILGKGIDQPSLAKTDMEMGGIIQPIDAIWNCVMFEFPRFVEQSLIIHYAELENQSWLFSKRCLTKLREEGLQNAYIRDVILHSTRSFFPYMREKFACRNFFKTCRQVAYDAAQYGKHIDSTYSDIKINSRYENVVKYLYRKHFPKLATFLWMLWVVVKKKYK